MGTDRPQTWTERKLALTAAHSTGRRVVVFTDADAFSCTVHGLGNGMVSVDRSMAGAADVLTLREEEIVGIEPVAPVKPVERPGEPKP